MLSDEDGGLLLSFTLYDANGKVVAQTTGPEPFPRGVTVRCKKGELLLQVPANGKDNMRYTLYNQQGQLLTWSDGSRTKIYPLLRMEGNSRAWPGSRPAAS